MTTRKNTFLLKRSNVPGKVPSPGDLQLGELALNTSDVILYASGTTTNQVLPIGWDRLSTLSGGTVNGDIISTGYFSGTTYYGDGSNLTGIPDYYVTGGTYSSGTLTLNRQNGSVSITGFTSGGGGDYLPLSGGTVYGDTNFTGGLTAKTITLDTTYTGTTGVGQITWNTDFGVPQVGMVGGNVVGKIGESVYAYVKNVDSSTLNKGEVVYIFGASGDKMSVKRASSTGDTTSSKTLGVVAESISVNGLGYILTQGTLDGLNLGSYTAGDILWLSPTPGQFTNVKSYAPNHLVFVGVVQRANNGNGQMYVKPQNGYELDELHNVAVTGATNGDLLIYNSGTTLWENSKTLTGTYTVNGGLTITGDTTISGNLTVTGNTGISWFSSNTSSDLVRITQTGSGNALVVEDSTNPDTTSFVINGSGIVGVGVNPSVWASVTSQPYVGMVGTGNRVYVSGNLIAGGDKLGIGYYNSTNPFNITNVISGNSVTSSFGSLLESYENGQFVIGIRDNDPNDGFNILSHNGGYTGTSEYSKLIATFKGSGKIGFGGIKNPTETLEVSGNTIVSGTLSGGTMVITNQPTSGYTTTQILMRNSTSGQVEITDSTSPSIYNYGMSYVMTTFNYLT